MSRTGASYSMTEHSPDIATNNPVHIRCRPTTARSHEVNRYVKVEERKP
jgi:hypothetical protein